MASIEQRELDAAAHTLAALNDQADGVRAELSDLRRELAALREDDDTRSAQLLEANENLVLSALHAKAIAEAAMVKLAELARFTQHDTLTHTPNRALMLDRIENAIALARRHSTHVAVVFVDVDHFKRINDTRGHAVGDEVLQLITRRLESSVRDSDTVSRHGGDEFLVLLTDVKNPKDVPRIAAKMLETLAAPTNVEGLQLSASLGIAVYPEDGDNAATLITRSDAAMYRAKKRGGGIFVLHNESDSSSDSFSITSPPPSHRDAVPLPPEPQLSELREANEHLTIATLSAQETRTHVEDAHRRQMKFLAMVAHELRNPLAPIRTAAQLLHRARTDESLLKRLQEMIERQAEHMARLVEDLLDGSRVSAGKFRLECAAIDLIGTLSLSVEACRPAIERRRQHFTVRFPSGAVPLQGDAVRLAQVFSNLLDNASKYTPEGGDIVLDVVVFQSAVAVRVSDNGIGISPQALPHIFDLFVQDAHALAVHSGGLGIGLAVVRELVEAHEGTVVATSSGKDRGSDFVVTLPRPHEANSNGALKTLR